MALCRLTIALALLIAVNGFARDGSPAVAGQPQPPSRNADRAPLKPGDVDLEKSRVYVLVGKKGLGHEHGVEGKIKSGSIDLDASQKVGAIEFDMAGFSADTADARKYLELKGTIGQATREKVTSAMLGPEVLDVEQFPTAVFTITGRSIKTTKKDGDKVVLKGDLTLHGKSRPLTLEARLEKKDGSSHLCGGFTILQSDFGITPYKAALGTVGVADELKIQGDLWIAGKSP